MVTDDGAVGGGIVMVPDMTGDGSLAPCGMVTWPGIRRPPVGGLNRYPHSYYMFLYRKQFIKMLYKGKVGRN